MNKKQGKFGAFMSGKGFYLVLLLCVAVVGVSGYMLLFAGGGDDLGYMDQPTNNEIANRPAVPTFPASPAPSPKLDDGDVPVAAVTVIPPVVSPRVSPKPSAPPIASPSSAATPAPTVKPSPKSAEVVFVNPIKGEVVNAFSDDQLTYDKTMGDWRVHLGIDLAAEAGAQVVAAADGTVAEIYDDAFWGSTVVIEHGNKLTTRYQNLMKKPVVAVGDAVTAGQVIGGVGSTAEAERREVNHLHFVLLKDNKPVNPLDYLPK